MMTTIEFKSFTEEDAEKAPSEFFEAIASDDILDMSDAPYEDKIRFMRYSLGFTDLINGQILSNISFLVYGKSISDDVFADPKIIFSNVEEYVDAKYDLKAELTEYGMQLLTYFLGALKSHSVVLPDKKIAVPASYKVILTSSSVHDISRLMNRYDISTEKVPLVFDSEYILDCIRYKETPVIKDFIDAVMGELLTK